MVTLWGNYEGISQYRVLVSRIDINTAPDIVWPEL
ncbi:tail fiber assembly protein [Escherichia coli]